MFSVKPGRGPSLMSAIVALFVGVPFIIFWISKASEMHAPGFFVYFGIAMLVLILVQALIGFYNAASRNRISQFDVTTGREEGDPFNRLVDSESNSPDVAKPATAQSFCPYCGTALQAEFKFCSGCGKAQPT